MGSTGYPRAERNGRRQIWFIRSSSTRCSASSTCSRSPLDGGRVAVGILPRFLARPLARVEPYGMMILMLIFVVSYLGARSGFNLLGWLIGVPADALIQFVLRVT